MSAATDGSEAVEVPPVRLVATDLDGTLLRPDGTLSERTICAVRAAQSSGIHVIPITGRPPRITWEVAKEAGLGPLGVCSNGAAVVDVSSMEVIEVQTMQAEVTARLVTVVREVFPGVLFAVEEMESFTHETGFMEPNWIWEDGTEQVDDIIEAVSSGCVKLVVRRPGWSAGAFLAELQDQVPKTVHITSSGLDWVEMASPGITKAHAVQRVCDRLGVGSAEVLAIGDNYNDLTVLAWAGRSAAPANAIPEVLAVVQQVLPPNGEDGVAQLLEGLAERHPLTPAQSSWLAPDGHLTSQ
jgi:Cof subfamily protein (haloacid dehalogenase superfamily)